MGRPSPHVVVFVHGLGETEYAWGSPNYGERLEEELGVTPVFVRYNTGRHISQNGASLAALLDELRDGGRARSRSSGTRWAGSSRAPPATAAATWTAKVRLTVSLGTPHAGAPLEQAVHAHERRAAPRARDAPVRPLPAPPQRGHPRPAPRLAGRRGLERPRPGRAAREGAARGAAAAERHARLRRRDDHAQRQAPARPPARRHARALPERVRPPPSASEHGLALGGTHHLALLNHPEVYAQLRRWLEPTADVPRPPAR